MVAVRRPCVAGQFYPAEPNSLQKMIAGFFADVQLQKQGKQPKAIIVPHAGYMYSGPIAATAYATLQEFKNIITRVILLGPAHRLAFNGLAATAMEVFATPLGEISLDCQAINAVLDYPFVNVNEDAYHMEHSLEVQLPFLQLVLHDFKLIPFLVGDAQPEMVARILETLWGEQETLIVISSDLSHYKDYATAKKMDLKTSESIEKLQYKDIAGEQACGRLPIQGLLLAAQGHDLEMKLLDLRNSGDTAGNKDQVVGYGAYYLG